MRLKFDSHDQNSFRCCLCCHVRTGTVFIGIWHLFANLMVIGLLVYSSIHPDILHQQMPKCDSNDGILVEFDNGSGYKISESETFGNYNVADPYTRKMTREDMCVAFAITLCTLTVTVFLLYGTCKNRPGYLLPFFSLQVFDFCLSCLTVVGYFSYAPNFKIWLREQGLSCLPGFKHVADIQGDWLMLLSLLMLVLFLSLKAYLIGVVWACYKYLQLRLHNRSTVREYTVDPDTEMLLPPKYEDAIKQSEENPPPPYSAVN